MIIADQGSDDRIEDRESLSGQRDERKFGRLAGGA